jgi:exosortase
VQDQVISTKTKPPSSAARSHSVAGLALPLITLGALWFVLCRHLSGEWSVNEQYSYGWFVPFFALLLFWLRWEDAPKPQAAAEAPNSKFQVPNGQPPEIRNPQSAIRNNNAARVAAMLAIPALLLLLPVRVFEVGNPDWRPLGWIHTASVVVLTLIYIWYAGGKPWLGHFAFPIAFIFVAVPWISLIEEPIVQGLMNVVAAVAAETLTLFGIPAQLEGSLIRINGGLVGVNEACSGVRSLQTALMIGLLFGELKRFDLTRRFALIVTAIALSLIANCGRAFFLVWVAANNGIGAVERWHDFAGYSIVALVFVGTLAAAALLSKGKSVKAKVENGERAKSREQPVSPATSNFYFLLSTSYFGIALLWLVFVEVASAAWYRAHERNLAAVERWEVRWPESSPGFREIQIDEGVKSALRFDKGREVTWRTPATSLTDAAETCFLFFFRWQPGTSTILRARAHRPDICLPSAGWRQIEDSGVRNYAATPEFSLPFHHFAFAHDAASNQRPHFAHAFFCLHEDTVRVDEPSQINAQRPSTWSAPDRLRVVREGRRNPGQQVMELVFISPVQVSSNEAEERFSQLVRDLIVASSK